MSNDDWDSIPDYERYVVKPKDQLGGLLCMRGLNGLWGQRGWVRRVREKNSLPIDRDDTPFAGSEIWLPISRLAAGEKVRVARNAFCLRTGALAANDLGTRIPAQETSPVALAQADPAEKAVAVARAQDCSLPPRRDGLVDYHENLFRTRVALGNSRLDVIDTSSGARATLISDVNFDASVQVLTHLSDSFTAFGEFGFGVESYSQFERNVSLLNPQVPLARFGAGLESEAGPKWLLEGKVFSAQTVYIRGVTPTQSELVKYWVVYLQAGASREIYRSSRANVRLGADALASLPYTVAGYSASLGYGAKARLEFARMWRGVESRMGIEYAAFFGDTSFSKQERRDATLFFGTSF